MAATWYSDHSAIYRNLYLHLAIANDLSLAIGFNKDRLESNSNATRVPIQLLQPNAQSRIINKIKVNKNSRTVVRCIGACLSLTQR
jgi:hypothetical protein